MSATVEMAALEEVLQLGPIGGLRALAFFAEREKELEVLASAVFLAGLQLRWQTQVLGLPFTPKLRYRLSW